MKKYKVLFCDMDGTLIETASGETFPNGIWDMKFKFDVLDAIKYLSEAVQWFTDNDIPLFGINENPEQHTWTLSPKPYCHIYIDDAALGCPLRYDINLSNRGFVNWNRVESLLIKRELI